jgi:hypothetical protein
MSERERVAEIMRENKIKNRSSRIREVDFAQPSGSPADRVLFLHKTIGNKAVERMIRSGALQPKLKIGQPDDIYEQEADRIAGQVNQYKKVSDRAVGTGIEIPVIGEEDKQIEIGSPDLSNLQSNKNTDALSMVEQPAGSGSGTAGGGEETSSCDQPLSMSKVTSGQLQGGKSMDDYYPDLVGRGYWQNSGSAGPWDTGSRVGSKAQLFGTIPSPCRPELFSLAQTVTRTRDRINGVTDPTEGQTFDDIAKSGRNASVPPFRQDWLGGGYNISMADPPSIGYSSTTNAEWDRDFVTSLKGPGGQRSVNWSISIRIENGVVTRNTIS